MGQRKLVLVDEEGHSWDLGVKLLLDVQHAELLSAPQQTKSMSGHGAIVDAMIG
jgi:hypothetical protein